jgi:ATP-binding cassette subfamily B protein
MLTRARREASSRPLSMVMRTFSLVQQASRWSASARCWPRSRRWAALILAARRAAGVHRRGQVLRRRLPPVPLAHARDPRCRCYLETACTARRSRQGGQALRARAALPRSLPTIFERVYGEDRKLTLAPRLCGARPRPARHRRVLRHVRCGSRAPAIAGTITLGAMTMYVMLFRQAQPSSASCSATSAACTRTTSTCRPSTSCSTPDRPAPGGVTVGAVPGDGVRFDDVSFTYPGAATPALEHITLHVPPRLQARHRRRERLGQDHPHQAARRPLHADRRPRHHRRPRGAASGTSSRCAAASASSSRTSCATSSPSARTSAPATSAPSRIASAGPPPPSRAWPRR